jgi:prephenate dehydrogenase
MNVAVVGLGLIGGSFCKAISARTEHACFGIDINESTLASARKDGVIKESITENDLSKMDMTIVCLHPKQTIEFILKNASKFRKGSIVIDSCGVKNEIVSSVTKSLNENGVFFIGCHPMAGREFSGYDYSLESLFDNASFIITPDENLPIERLDTLKSLVDKIGFKRVVVTTPQEHDRIISYTSQLAHIVSSAYIKSPTLEKQSGFSAGSFQDLTRVAKLNEDMWTELFLMNSEPLANEIDTIIKHLSDYKNAIEKKNADTLKELLREGRILKEMSNHQNFK